MANAAATVITPDQVKACAAAAGFDLCGIAVPGAYPELGFLQEWLARGHHADMAYMARTAERRADVRAVMPSATAVIMLGTIYNTERPYSTEHADPRTARIARYAWGDDYHDVIDARMRDLILRVEALSGPFEHRAYVDTGPVQERVYAKYAGLGWIGKNTCLINTRLGSWLFLSAIICDLPLAPDTPATDHCGRCTLCIDACPTGAITAPYELDARRCLSYLTIENKGAIPEEYRSAVGNQAYGCDICQDVCPWNRRAAVSDDQPWQPRAGLDAPGSARAVEPDRRRAARAVEGQPHETRRGAASEAEPGNGARQHRRSCGRGRAGVLRRRDEPGPARPGPRRLGAGVDRWLNGRPSRRHSIHGVAHDRWFSSYASPVHAADAGPELRQNGRAVVRLPA